MRIIPGSDGPSSAAARASRQTLKKVRLHLLAAIHNTGARSAGETPPALPRAWRPSMASGSAVNKRAAILLRKKEESGVELLRKRRRNVTTAKVLVIAVGVLSTLILMAQQTGSGTIRGVVRDPSSAVVAGARVTITHTATMTKSSTTSNEVGFFDFPPVQTVGLRPGPRKLRTRRPCRQNFRTKPVSGCG